MKLTNTWQNIHNAWAKLTKDPHVFIEGKFPFTTKKKENQCIYNLIKGKVIILWLYFTFLMQIIPTVPMKCR